jgi:hypothetical protein
MDVSGTAHEGVSLREHSPLTVLPAAHPVDGQSHGRHCEDQKAGVFAFVAAFGRDSPGRAGDAAGADSEVSGARQIGNDRSTPSRPQK